MIVRARTLRGFAPGLLLAAACSAPMARVDLPTVDTPLPMAFMVGEVTARSAVVWARCENGDEVVLSLAPGEHSELRTPVQTERDFTTRVELANLQPSTQYRYTLWCRGGDVRTPGAGSFKTAPEPEARESVRLAWSGDVGGQNVCRDREHGYLPYRALRVSQPDFFIAMGDMIYADDACREVGRYGNAQVPGPATPAIDVEGFRAHWRYARADPHVQRLHAATSIYAIWDDHEIIDDARPEHDVAPGHRGVHLIPPAREAFLDYHPFPSAGAEERRLFRSFRWGRHLEIFFLDTRSYRDSNRARDSNSKSMLGPQQIAWLRDALMQSDATWKVVVSSVPLAIPTGAAGARDGWASGGDKTGFATELSEILRTMQRLTRRQVLWITADVHFGSVIRYVPFPDDPDFVVHEIVTGPLNAGIFPKRDLDRTLQPQRLHFHGPDRAEDVGSYLEAARWFNFGTAHIDEAGVLKLGLVNAMGEPVYELELLP